jgi:MFS family permease
VLTHKFPENREKFIAFGEAASGIGLMIGPGIAGFLYTYVRYFWAFTGFVILVGISATLCMIYIPQSMNQSFADEDATSQKTGTNTGEDKEAQQAPPKIQVDYVRFLTDRRTLFSVITCMYCCFLY